MQSHRARGRQPRRPLPQDAMLAPPAQRNRFSDAVTGCKTDTQNNQQHDSHAKALRFFCTAHFRYSSQNRSQWFLEGFFVIQPKLVLEPASMPTVSVPIRTLATLNCGVATCVICFRHETASSSSIRNDQRFLSRCFLPRLDGRHRMGASRHMALFVDTLSVVVDDKSASNKAGIAKPRLARKQD